MSNSIIKLKVSFKYECYLFMICPGLIDNLEIMRNEIGATIEDEKLALSELADLIYNHIDNWSYTERPLQVIKTVSYLFTNHETQNKKHIKLLGLYSYWLNHKYFNVYTEHEFQVLKDILNEDVNNLN